MATRSEQREQRKQAILMTALDLFVRRGYQMTKISDIAQAVGMSTGLMFHYFDSKEELYEELLKIGADVTVKPEKADYDDPLGFFSNFLKGMFKYNKEQHWVLEMFVLMTQARQSDGIPESTRSIAQGTDQAVSTLDLIRQGQRDGVIKKGNPKVLSSAFWCAVQGIMSQLAVTPDMETPDPEWVIDILRSHDALSKV